MMELDDLSFIPASIAETSSSCPLNDEELACEAGDVGVLNVSTNGFSLIFPLEKFQQNSSHVNNIPEAFLLGKIVNPSGVERIIEMSHTKKSERDNIDFKLSYG